MINYMQLTEMMDIPYSIDDIEQDVIKYYFNKKQKIPQFEKEFLEAYRKQEAEKRILHPLWNGPLPDVPSKEYISTEKPAYGTPAFWKDWWAKKKAKEKAALEAGVEIPVKEKKVRKKKDITVSS